MRAGDHQQGTVFHGAILDHDADLEDIVVGVGIEGPILVPLDRLAAARRLDVELGVVHAQIRPDELGDKVHDLRRPQ